MNGNLLSTLRPQSRAVHKLVTVALGVAILTLASKVQVPFWPVPMTLQTLAVLMIGATAGARLGGSTVLAWLGLGARAVQGLRLLRPQRLHGQDGHRRRPLCCQDDFRC